MVDFFAEAPEHLQGGLLLAMTRASALLAEFTDGRSMLLIHFRDAAAVWRQGDQTRCPAASHRVDDSSAL